MAKFLRKFVTFSLEEPQAAEVRVAGDFTGWEQHPIPLKRVSNGLWKARVEVTPGSHEYLFLVDGQWRSDPACQARRVNPYGGQNCVCEVD